MAKENYRKAERGVRFHTGYTPEQLGELTFEQFDVYREGILEREKTEDRRAMVAAAFTGYQLGLQSGAIKPDKSFERYLREVGLSERSEELSDDQKAKKRREAISRAERVRKKFNAGQLNLRAK